MVLLVCQGAVEEYCTANMLLRFFIHLLEMFQSISETELVFATILVIVGCLSVLLLISMLAVFIAVKRSAAPVCVLIVLEVLLAVVLSN